MQLGGSEVQSLFSETIWRASATRSQAHVALAPLCEERKAVDGRVKPGHDGERGGAPALTLRDARFADFSGVRAHESLN